MGMFSRRRARFRSTGEGIVRRCVFAMDAARWRRERSPSHQKDTVGRITFFDCFNDEVESERMDRCVAM